MAKKTPKTQAKHNHSGDGTEMVAGRDMVPIASLKGDSRNARLHSDKNLDAIKASLKRFGQTKPVVLDADGIVIAGNGTMAAAMALGWRDLWVHRTKLRGTEARAYALADNRSAELAEWDLDELNRTIDELESASIDLGEVGFTDDELEALVKGDFEEAHGFTPKPPPKEPEEKEESITPQFKVIITCATEKQQAEVIRWCEKQGLEFKAPSV
jgi:ParB-like chromosome segregation protein Spo0J